MMVVTLLTNVITRQWNLVASNFLTGRESVGLVKMMVAVAYCSFVLVQK